MVQQLCSFLASSSNMTVMEIVLISALTRDLRALQSHVHRSILAAPETSRPSSFVLCHFVAVAITSNVGASERTSRNSSLSLFINVFNRFADGCFVGASLQFTNVFTFSMISSFCCVSSLQPEDRNFEVFHSANFLACCKGSNCKLVHANHVCPMVQPELAAQAFQKQCCCAKFSKYSLSAEFKLIVLCRCK